LYLLLLSWPLVGAFAPNVVAIGWSVITFLLLLRTQDSTKILFAFITLLMFSDSRASMLAFAPTAKILVVVILSIYVLASFANFRHLENKIFKNFLPFLIFGVLATLWSVDVVPAFQKSLSYLLVFFVVPMLFLKAIEENRKLAIDTIVFFTVILAIGLVIHFVSPDITTIAGRYRGLLGNPNGLGVFLIVLFPLCYLFWKHYRDSYDFTKLAWIFVIVFGLSLVLTGSRTALFTLIIFFVFSRIRYFSNAVTIFGFLILVVSYEYILQQLPQIIISLGLQEYLRLETLLEGSGRNIAWAFAWQKIDQVFFAGGGFGYTEYIYRVNYAELSRMGHQGNAHSSYLTIWLDTGLIGLVLFIFGFLRTIVGNLKTSVFALPVVFSIVFSTYYESWLAASLNPFTSIFLMVLTLQAQDEVPELITEDEVDED